MLKKMAKTKDLLQSATITAPMNKVHNVTKVLASGVKPQSVVFESPVLCLELNKRKTM